MPWYAAHLIEFLEPQDETNNLYLVYENIVLVAAQTSQDAWEIALKIGKRDYGSRGEGSANHLTRQEKPSDTIFGGIRCLVECQPTSTEATANLEEFPLPGGAMEITYIPYWVEGKENMVRLLKDEPVVLMFAGTLKRSGKWSESL